MVMKKMMIIFLITAISLIGNYAFATCGVCSVEATHEHAHGVV